MAKVNVLGIEVEAGERTYATLPVTKMASGYDVGIPVHILNGKRPGPRLLLTALSHGDAFGGLECIRQTIEQVDLEKLSGTIIAVPCQNPIGFEAGTRNTPTDQYNMNRTYPGNPRGWFTEQLAAAVSPLCREADMLIDWHGGGYGTAINYVLVKRTTGALNDEILEYAFAYGLEYIYDGPPAGPTAAYAGSLTGYMTELGKPSIIAEVGSGMVLPMDIISGSVQGNFNIMKKMGMIEGDLVLPKTQYLATERPLIRPKHGGMFYPMFGGEYLNKSVPKGTLIAQVRNPLTLKVIEEIFAPCEETVFLMLRGFMTKVHPGEYAYILCNQANAKCISNG